MKSSTSRALWIGGAAAGAAAVVGTLVVLTSKPANASPQPSPGPGPGPTPVPSSATVNLVSGQMPNVVLTTGGTLNINAPADPGPPSLRPEIVEVNADNLGLLGTTAPITGAGTSAGFTMQGPGNANMVVDWFDALGNAQQSTFQLVVVPSTGQ